MRILGVVVAIACLASCTNSYDFRGEGWSGHYRYPAEENIQERIGRREIVRWRDNPNEKERVGFIYTYETQVKGSRNKRQCHYLYDWTGSKIEGFITAEGEFYRFDKFGHISERVGEYPIVPTGVKMHNRYPLTDRVDLRDIDPYK